MAILKLTCWACGTNETGQNLETLGLGGPAADIIEHQQLYQATPTVIRKLPRNLTGAGG